jgi:hypothetical protein
LTSRTRSVLRNAWRYSDGRLPLRADGIRSNQRWCAHFDHCGSHRSCPVADRTLWLQFPLVPVALWKYACHARRKGPTAD